MARPLREELYFSSSLKKKKNEQWEKGEMQISEEGKYLFAFTSYKTFLFKLSMVDTEREFFLSQITCLFQKRIYL